jgi:hypothetical protein
MDQKHGQAHYILDPIYKNFRNHAFLAKSFWHNSIQKSSQQQIKLGFSVAM